MSQWNVSIKKHSKVCVGNNKWKFVFWTQQITFAEHYHVPIRRQGTDNFNQTVTKSKGSQSFRKIFNLKSSFLNLRLTFLSAFSEFSKSNDLKVYPWKY